MDWALLEITLCLFMLSALSDRYEVAAGNMEGSILGLVSMVAALAAVVWAFLNIPWYMVLLFCLGAAVFPSLVLNPRDTDQVLFVVRIKVVLQVVVVVLTGVLWLTAC